MFLVVFGKGSKTNNKKRKKKKEKRKKEKIVNVYIEWRTNRTLVSIFIEEVIYNPKDCLLISLFPHIIVCL